MTFWITATCCLLMAICGSARAQVPLPSDLSIKVPAANVPARVAWFSGAWGNGAWDGILPAALVVGQVASDGTASVVYAWGASTRAGVAPAWKRMQGHIDNDQLTLHSPRGAVFGRYRFNRRLPLHHEFTLPTMAIRSRQEDSVGQVPCAA